MLPNEGFPSHVWEDHKGNAEMSEYVVALSGIGGQGVQLVGKILAMAATAESRQAMLASEYGGAMRGGNSLATVVIGDAELRALPVLARADAVVALHSRYASQPAARLAPGGLVLGDGSGTDEVVTAAPHQRIAIPASDIATRIGNPMVLGLVLLGAFAAVTGIVTGESLQAAMRELVPAYRRQHVAANAEALRAGAEAAPALAHRLRLAEVVA